MSGISLHHPELRNCTYTLIHDGRPLKAPILCGVCGLTHHHKTYHLGLDPNGDVVVSETVFMRIEEAGLGELQPKTEVAKPPPMVVGIGMNGHKQLVVARERKER